ncbi:glucosaminidase domain-containing protein [Vibrio algicola]|uniref:Glucosaminidase n=1 Tax=Vibrio algicola TaxID=2662262 RepID=A0A5Q0TCY8_9VIBR|nr:glucosaminidase domain-containing protein [Vibrio algicola]
MMKKLIMAAIILVFWAVYYFQNHYTPSDSKPKAKVEKVTKVKTEHVDIDKKKRKFYNRLRPGFEKENQRVSKERKQILAMEASLTTNDVSSSQQKTARKLADMYNVELPADGINQQWVDDMLLRVNILPEALVLTQAANESAWGTSRFAKKANNFFGQWCYSEGCGVVPLHRVEGATHEVAKFDNAQASIHAYFMNMNRNNAYRSLRDIRQKLADGNKDLASMATALKLTDGLLSYSERGQDYVNDLQGMITHNHTYWKHQ